MERQIGEIFEHNGEWYQCVEDNYPFNCQKCCFYNGVDKCSEELTGCCNSEYRSDEKEIIFKKLEKVGGLTTIHGRLVQKIKNPDGFDCLNCCFCHKAACELTMTGTDIYDCGKGTIYIEIKQNQENMEEKKLNLKEFDLEKAKAGKPVCTRDGRKARIICFDRKNSIYPIIALVENQIDNKEDLLRYTGTGKFLEEKECDERDLMMLPEKKEGWVNVYKGGLLDTKSYPTKKEAFDKASPKDYVDTIKINWSE